MVKLASGDVTELQKMSGWKEKLSSVKGAAHDGIKIVKSLRGCHEALVHEPGSNRFATFVDTLHFTSEEANSLIEELRAAKFYDKFEYDPTVPGGWRCKIATLAQHKGGFCGSCGVQYEPGLRFCGECGTPTGQ